VTTKRPIKCASLYDHVSVWYCSFSSLLRDSLPSSRLSKDLALPFFFAYHLLLASPSSSLLFVSPSPSSSFLRRIGSFLFLFFFRPRSIKGRGRFNKVSKRHLKNQADSTNPLQTTLSNTSTEKLLMNT